MKIKVNQQSFNKALGIVSKVAAGSRTTLAILNNVLIRAANKKITLTTTNLEIAAVSFVVGSIEEDGVTTVPVRLLSEFVSILPKDEDVILEVKDNKVTVSAGKYQSVINATIADEFPELPTIDEKNAVTFRSEVEQFKKSVADVAIASSNDTTRPVLTGVYTYIDSGNLYMVATDGYRLAEKMFIKGVDGEVKVIIPASSLQDVVRSISTEASEVEIILDENQVKFRFEETEITSKLIDGSFPDHKQLIPKKTDIEVVLKKDELVRITKLAALFAREVGGSIVCETRGNKFVVASVANEYGENESEMDIEGGEDGKVTLNSRFLLDALNVMEDDEMKFGFSGKIAPIMLRGVKQKDYTHIIMPLKS
jgi:DNA polymerase-3 subunit beta